MGEISEKVKIARRFKDEMAVLTRKIDYLYYEAIRTLDVLDTITAYGYFYGDREKDSFEESLKDDNA